MSLRDCIRLVSTKNLPYEKWLEVRQQGIGGSDIGKIAGLSRYGNAFTVYHEKISNVAEYKEESEAMAIGSALEDWVCEEYTRRTGNKLRRVNAVLQHPRYPWMLANVDRVIPSWPNGVFEAKTSGTKGAWEDNRIPDSYLLQVHWYLTVTNLPYAEIAALLGGYGGFEFVTRRVEADKEMSQYLIDIGATFWDAVQRREPPPVDGTEPSTELLKQLYPGGEAEELTLPDDYEKAIAAYREAQEMEKVAQDRKAEARNILENAMGNHEVALCSNFQLRWQQRSSRRLDTDRLKTERPDIYEGYVKESTSRTFTIKEKKEEA